MAALRRTQPVAKAHVTYRLTCWHCRAAFIARRLDAEYCSGRCRKRAERIRKAKQAG
jgi:hypothetical protein